MKAITITFVVLFENVDPETGNGVYVVSYSWSEAESATSNEENKYDVDRMMWGGFIIESK